MSMPTKATRRRGVLLMVLACLGLGVAACGSGNDASGDAGAPTQDDGLIINLSIPLSQPFAGAVKMGSDAAAKALGTKYQYTAPADLSNMVPDYTRLFNEAIARKPKAILFINFNPKVFKPLIKKATDAGIAVSLYNSGSDTFKDVGAIGYAGEEPISQGQAAGKAALESGAKTLVCVNHLEDEELQRRCAGARQVVEAAGGTVAELNIPPADSTNDAAITQDLQGYLKSHGDIDGMITLGGNVATDAVLARKNLGKSNIKIGTTDVSTGALKAVKSGELDYVIDQQPYLQGYYALQMAVQYLRYGIKPNSAIDTGGLIIDKSNVDRTLEIQKQYAGIRGAQ